jgi:hypothetical protein
MHIDVEEWDGLMDHMNQPHIVESFIQSQEQRKEAKDSGKKEDLKENKK